MSKANLKGSILTLVKVLHSPKNKFPKEVALLNGDKSTCVKLLHWYKKSWLIFTTLHNASNFKVFKDLQYPRNEEPISVILLLSSNTNETRFEHLYKKHLFIVVTFLSKPLITKLVNLVSSSILIVLPSWRGSDFPLISQNKLGSILLAKTNFCPLYVAQFSDSAGLVTLIVAVPV